MERLDRYGAPEMLRGGHTCELNVDVDASVGGEAGVDSSACTDCKKVLR